MKLSKLLLLFSFFIISCATVKKDSFSPEVIFYTNTEDFEVISDYEYHIGNVKEYYTERDIIISETSDRDIKIGSKSITIDVEKSFAMVMIDQQGEYKIDYIFGTDIDMIMVINVFFNIDL